MKTILAILQKAGGWHASLYVKIENPPYLPLVIETLDESGPLGLPAISVCHCGEQNGDAMRNPEIGFELGYAGGVHLNPFSWRNDYVAGEQWSRFIRDSHYCYHGQLHEQHEKFAKSWRQQSPRTELLRGLHAHVRAWLVARVEISGLKGGPLAALYFLKNRAGRNLAGFSPNPSSALGLSLADCAPGLKFLLQDLPLDSEETQQGIALQSPKHVRQ